MNTNYKYFIITVNFITGCSSLFIVKSDPPQAEVFVVQEKTNEKKSLGKTPLEQSQSEVRKLISEPDASGAYFSLAVEKEGFQSKIFKVPLSRFGVLVTELNVKLEEQKESKEKDPKEKEKEIYNAKNILNRIFLAQKFAIELQFERAQIELDKILENVPNFPKALSMKGAIYYTQKNYSESLKWYEEALKYDPQMDDAVKMVTKLRSIQLGERSPASSNNLNTDLKAPQVKAEVKKGAP